MRVEFEGRSILLNDVCYTWFIESEINSYRLGILFCGGIDDRGKMDLENSLNAEITLTEITEHKPGLLSHIRQNALYLDMDYETNTVDLVLQPDRRDFIRYIDYDSYDESLKTLKYLLNSVTTTLLQCETNCNELQF